MYSDNNNIKTNDMTNKDKNLIQLQIEKKVSELLRIHNNTLWYGITEEKANLLGERMNVLNLDIEKLRSLLL